MFFPQATYFSMLGIHLWVQSHCIFCIPQACMLRVVNYNVYRVSENPELGNRWTLSFPKVAALKITVCLETVVSLFQDKVRHQLVSGSFFQKAGSHFQLIFFFSMTC